MTLTYFIFKKLALQVIFFDLLNLAIGSSGSASYLDISRSYRPALLLDSYLEGENSFIKKTRTIPAQNTHP